MDEGPLQLVSDSQRENEASENKAWGPVPGMYETCDGKPSNQKEFFPRQNIYICHLIS